MIEIFTVRLIRVESRAVVMKIRSRLIEFSLMSRARKICRKMVLSSRLERLPIIQWVSSAVYYKELGIQTLSDEDWYHNEIRLLH